MEDNHAPKEDDLLSILHNTAMLLYVRSCGIFLQVLQPKKMPPDKLSQGFGWYASNDPDGFPWWTRQFRPNCHLPLIDAGPCLPILFYLCETAWMWKRDLLSVDIYRVLRILLHLLFVWLSAPVHLIFMTWLYFSLIALICIFTSAWKCLLRKLKIEHSTDWVDETA